MGSVGPSSATDSSLGGDMSDGAFFWVKRLSLSVGLQILEEAKNVLARFLWESTIVMTNILAHGVSSGTTSVPSERNDVLLLENTLDVFDGLDEVHATKSTGSLISVLVVSSEVVNSSRGGYNR